MAKRKQETGKLKYNTVAHLENWIKFRCRWNIEGNEYTMGCKIVVSEDAYKNLGSRANR
jgi:hypothetical protein